jgi:hypothetical protein
VATTPRSARRGTPELTVLGSPRRSLFDAVRPGLVQQAGEGTRGPGGMVLAALHQPGTTAGGADRVVLGGRAFGRPADRWAAVDDEGAALGVAYGMAIARVPRTPAARTWCLLRGAALSDGRALEMAALLPALPVTGLVVLVVGAPETTARAGAVLRAVGVEVVVADNGDAWSVISAMDRAGRLAEQGPSAVVAPRAAVGG